MNDNDILLDIIYSHISSSNWGYLWHIKRPIFDKLRGPVLGIAFLMVPDEPVMIMRMTRKNEIIVGRFWPLCRYRKQVGPFAVGEIPASKEVKKYKKARLVKNCYMAEEHTIIDLHEPDSIDLSVRIIRECWDLIRNDLRVINKTMYLSPHAACDRAYLEEARRKFQPL
jgi:hypothetical protein